MRRPFAGEGFKGRCRPGVEGLETRDLLSHVDSARSRIGPPAVCQTPPSSSRPCSCSTDRTRRRR